MIIKVRDKKTNEFSYVVKSDPATRQLGILGFKNRRLVKNFCFITKEKLLLELKTSH